MTTIERPAATTSTPTRDAGIDLVRAVSVVAVVAVHVLLACVALAGDHVEISTAVEDEPWFAASSWVLQVLPLLFVVGGFASAVQWRRLAARGTTARAFVASRAAGLLAPALPMLAVVALALGLAGFAGADAELVDAGSYWIGRPLWFLAVYLGATALVPVMLRLHERAPRRTLATLIVCAVVVDVVRVATGADVVGAANLAFVWLALQQLGFWLADGAIDRWSTRTALLVLGGALASLCTLVAAGASPEMLLDQNNPPTTMLVLLGLAQVAVLRLVRGRVDALAAGPRVAAVVAWLSPRCMHVYLWHMPALATVMAVWIASGIPLPDAGSLGWWLTRPVLLVATLGIVGLGLLASAPRRRRIEDAPRAAPLALAVVLAIGVPVVALVAGMSAMPALVALALGAVALRLLHGGAAIGQNRAHAAWAR